MDHRTIILTLEEMLQYGSDLTQLHTLTFIFTFPSEAGAEQAVTLLKAKEGVEGTVYIMRPPLWKALFTRPQYAVYGTRNLIPDRDELYRLTSVFNAIAKQWGGTFDRWEGKLVRNP
jgi:hypothetical protein